MQSPYINKRVIVLLDYFDPAGQNKKKVEVYGVITRITDEDGIFIEQANGQGEFKLALSPDALHEAAPGKYRLLTTGETIVDPDYLVKRTFSAHLPPDKTPLLATFGKAEGRGDFNLPKICAHCGKHTEALSLWELKTTHRRSAGGFGTLALLAGIHISQKTTYTFKVLVCKPCSERLALLKQLKWLIMGGVPALAIFCFYLGRILRNQGWETADNFVALFMLAFIVLTPITIMVFRNMGQSFGRFNFRRGYFDFRNPEFQKAFATLNPTFVKRPPQKKGGANVPYTVEVTPRPTTRNDSPSRVRHSLSVVVGHRDQTNHVPPDDPPGKPKSG